jgi:hypothetical protein
MESLGNVGQVEPHFGPLEIMFISAQDRYTVCAECATAWKSFWAHLVKWKLVSVCLETILITAQDRCTVCAECTTGIEIFLGQPNGTSW